MDLFLLKKIIGFVLMPFPISLMCLFIAVIGFKRWPKLAHKSLLLGCLVLFLSSWPPFANLVMKPIEHQYVSYQIDKKPLDYIVVLGGYHVADPNLPPTSQLAYWSLQRLVEALRIYQKHPEARIIFSGAGEPQSHAQVMKQAAISLGIKESHIITVDFPKDTEEEAQLIAPRIAGTRAVLITQGDHMPRAMNYFYQYGAAPTAAPVIAWIKEDNQADNWRYFMPQAGVLQVTTFAWYETLGLIVQWFKTI
jgi:uncharacterized SAM-binding protein YcdF (DUF218 family)